ncbi:MAG TPA: hypothetical protein PK156_43415 [Polyangium sp.]|nr:hypothetical protein [Polyangium sp.]
MRIAFLPTGRTEWNGLVDAFRVLFPGEHHEFDVLPSDGEMRSFPDKYPYPGFTSNPLTLEHETDPPEAALELVERAAREALGDKHREAADLVIVLDDLEPANMHQPDRVAKVFRNVVIKHVAGLPSQATREKTQAKLLERVSFHLLVPMVEALFFADPTALHNAGVSEEVTEAYPSDRDPEQFEIADSAYLNASDDACSCWKALGAKKKSRPKWLGLPSWWNANEPDEQGRVISWRQGHPKGYLQWLCKDGSHKKCTTYDESIGGGRALSSLSWPALLGREKHFGYLRALISDVSAKLQQDPATGKVVGTIANLTDPLQYRPDAVLRNL